MRSPLALAALLAACGADDAPLGPDAGAPDVDAGADGAPGCRLTTVADLEAQVAATVTHLAASPRASSGARTATRTYLVDQLSGLGLDTSQTSYGPGANVIARLPATSGATDWILVGAHFDTVQGSPGASDNATGVAVVLATARALAALPCRAHGVMFVGFDQEEVGLVGSTQLAGQLFRAGTALVAVHSIDQVGWDSDHDRRFEIEQPTATLWAEYQAAAAATGVEVVRTSSGATDHVSFRERGYPAVGVSEEFAGGDTTPHYHTAGDTAATVDTAFTAAAARLVTAVVAAELGAAP